MRLGGDRVTLPTPLQQPADERGTYAKAIRDFLTGFQILVAGLNNARPQIQGVGLHATPPLQNRDILLDQRVLQ